MNHPSDPLPLLPAELLRRYSCAEPTDTRFRAIARLRQSLWREQHGFACGRYLDANGRTRRLGSRVSYRVGRTGINLVDLTLIPLVQHEIAYREVGAVINVERLWTNLLASQALTFNLFGPFKQRPALAGAVLSGPPVRDDRQPALRMPIDICRHWLRRLAINAYDPTAERVAALRDRDDAMATCRQPGACRAGRRSCRCRRHTQSEREHCHGTSHHMRFGMLEH